MSNFWFFARRLADRPVMLTMAMVMAFVSASSLGAGLLAFAPILRIMLFEGSPSLQSIAAEKASWLGPGIIDLLPTDRFQSLVVLICGVALLTILGGFANFSHAAMSSYLSVQTIGGIRRRFFRHTLHLPLSRIVGRSSDVVSRIMHDTDVLLGGFVALTSKFPAEVTKGIAAIVVAFILDWRLSLTAMLITPVLYVIIRKLGKRVRRASRGAMLAKSELLNSANAALQGLRVVKVYSNERLELNRFQVHNASAVREQFRTHLTRAFGSPLVETITVIFLGALVVLASKPIIDGSIKPDVFISTIVVLALGGASIKPVTRAVQEVQIAEAAATRLLELQSELPEPMWTNRSKDGRMPRLPRHRESVVFEDVRLVYPESEEPALDGVTVKIPHGATYAFVGPNGSGKTSLLSLTPRLFEPQSGRVLIDGKDISKVDLRSLRRQIAVVTQETVIFRGSIRENIAYGRRSPAEPPTEQQIIDAAKRARAHDFIMRLPGGYDARVGEQGATLSGGQRQRLAIARAILRDPAILILDEATSMIDADSEHHIADALAEFSSGRTCLIVAHRLSTVVSADRIIVMDRGRIVDAGTHEELLESSPLYQTLARTQLVAATA